MSALSTSSLPKGHQKNYAPSPNTPEGISFEDIAKYPGRACLGRTGAPSKISFSGDDASLVFLSSSASSLTQTLYRLDLTEASSIPLEIFSPDGLGEEDNLSEEEKLRRERTRQLHTGITSFELASGAGTLLCPVGNDLFVEEGSSMRKAVDGGSLPGAVLDAHLSRDGSLVAFVCERELYACGTTEGSEARRITFDARGSSVTNGLADFVAMEEMERYGGFWISPDSRYVAFEQSDESHIEKFRIMHSGKEDPTRQEDHHYPFAGKENPKVRLGLVGVDGKEVRWLDVAGVFGEDMYLARVQWGGHDELYVQVMNREQTELVLLRFTITDTLVKQQELLREKQPEAWINLHNMLVPLKNGGFIWASERTGFNHLYRYDHQGNLLTTLTSGDWMVETTSPAMIDEISNLVYFTATKDGPLESHLYCTSLSSGPIRRVTPPGGTNSILSISNSKKTFVTSHSSTTQPFQVTLRSLSTGAVIRTLFDGSAQLPSLPLPPPQFFTLTASDQTTTLHGALYIPDSPPPYPTIVSVYGGPHAQTVLDSWSLTADLRAQRLRSKGYLVLKLDNRGSSRRGLRFETAIRRDMGNLEVVDQVAAVRHAVSLGLAEDRVGIYGWSYGGYMSAMCLAKHPDVFKAAVAGAMVSSWDGYDTCYTERYMGTPEGNPGGYERSSVMNHAQGIEGSLMIVHGLIDENVHFRHSARLINKLVEEQKHYELLLFPDERHVPRGVKDKVFMEQRIASFFERTL